MRSSLKLLFSTICLTSMLFASSVFGQAARPFSITEFNASWFGLNGDPNNELGNEPRVNDLKEFLQKNSLFTDVMVFEEIVDIGLLKSAILNNSYDCQSYERDDPKSQHIVICVKPEFRFDMAENASSYVIEEVDLSGNLRPAVHGILKTQDGTRLAHIFGVHLKANSEKSAMRLKQTQFIADYLKREPSVDPVIIVGDFNTFGTDPVDMEKQFGTAGLLELDLPELYTWASVREHFPPAKLDRVWISNTLVPKIKSAHVVGPCNSPDKKLLAVYNATISDHCPTTILITP